MVGYIMGTKSPVLPEINYAGYSDDPSVNRFGPGSRNRYIVHYVMSGSGFYNGTEVKSGEGFLIYPNQKEEYYPSEDDPWSYLWFDAAGEEMKHFFERYNADPNTQIFSYVNISDLHKASDLIAKSNGRIVDSALMFELFLHIFNGHTDAMPFAEKRATAKDYTDFCTKYIETNLHQRITVREMTDLLGITQPYLYKIFHDRFKMSVKKYIISEKCRHSKNLLAQTDLSITEIAASVGYDDVLAFSKMFKANEGSSPSKFRRQCRIK